MCMCMCVCVERDDMLIPTGYPSQHSSRHGPQRTQHAASTAAAPRYPQGRRQTPADAPTPPKQSTPQVDDYQLDRYTRIIYDIHISNYRYIPLARLNSNAYNTLDH